MRNVPLLHTHCIEETAEQQSLNVWQWFMYNILAEIYLSSWQKVKFCSHLKTVKNLPAMRETWVQSLVPRVGRGEGRSLEKGRATHSSILAWRIPWTEEPGELQSLGSVGGEGRKELDTTERLTLSFSFQPFIRLNFANFLFLFYSCFFFFQSWNIFLGP